MQEASAGEDIGSNSNGSDNSNNPYVLLDRCVEATAAGKNATDDSKALRSQASEMQMQTD